jgi:hypothetical protein
MGLSFTGFDYSKMPEWNAFPDWIKTSTLHLQCLQFGAGVQLLLRDKQIHMMGLIVQCGLHPRASPHMAAARCLIGQHILTVHFCGKVCG